MFCFKTKTTASADTAVALGATELDVSLSRSSYIEELLYLSHFCQYTVNTAFADAVHTAQLEPLRLLVLAHTQRSWCLLELVAPE